MSSGPRRPATGADSFRQVSDNATPLPLQMLWLVFWQAPGGALHPHLELWDGLEGEWGTLSVLGNQWKHFVEDPSLLSLPAQGAPGL